MNRYFYEQLKKNKLKLTKERREIFAALQDSPSPLTIVQLAQKTKHSMSHTTVYRNVEILEKAGIIVKMYTGWKYRIELSAQFNSHHHHITCMNCGDIAEFDEPEVLVDELRRISKQHSYAITSHIFEISGYCRNCNLSKDN